MTASPLLNRPAPFHDESLASWLTRLAYGNHIQPQALRRHLQQLACLPRIPTSLNRPSHPKLFDGLHLLTQYSADVIYQCTVHRFSHFLALPHQSPLTVLSSATSQPLPLLPKTGLSGLILRRCNWCPHCLRESAYVRLHWHITPLACCEHHQCWLLRQCPACCAATSQEGIVLGRCTRCQHDLTTATANSIPPNTLLAPLTKLLMDWLYLRPIDSTLGLPAAPVAVLVRILHGLRHVAQRAGNSWEHHIKLVDELDCSFDIPSRRLLSQFEAGSLYSTALQGILNWPHGFFAFATAYRARPARCWAETGLRSEFGNFYTWISRFWAFPEFEFLQLAFNDYLIDHFAAYQILFTKRIAHYPDLVERVDYLDLTYATRFLDCSSQVIYRLIAQGGLTPVSFADCRRGVWFSRSQLQSLKQRWHNQLQLGQLVVLLGISLDPVRQLVLDGLLPPVASADRFPAQQLTVYQRTVSDFLDSLRQHVHVCDAIHEDWIPVSDLFIRTVFPGLTMAVVLQRILTGSLTAYHLATTCLPLNELWFLPSEVAQLDAALWQEHDAYRRHEVKRRLGISWRTFYNLLETSFLKPTVQLGKRLYFRRDDVVTFHTRWLLLGEMARLFHIHPASLFNLIRNHHLFTPVYDPRQTGCGCYIFDRAAILEWHHSYIFLAELRLLIDDLVDFQTFVQQYDIDSRLAIFGIFPRRAVLDFAALHG